MATRNGSQQTLVFILEYCRQFQARYESEESGVKNHKDL